MTILCFILYLVLFTINGQVIFDECLDSIQLVHLGDFRNFTDQQTTCEENGANLVKVNSLEIFTRVNTFKDSIINADHFIGAQRFNDDLFRDPLQFSFIDGTTFSPGFGDEGGIFPWDSNEPNNRNERCVLIQNANNGLFNDFSCSQLRPAICEVNCQPTVSPTLSPTVSPSASPTVLSEPEKVESKLLSTNLYLILMLFFGILFLSSVCGIIYNALLLNRIKEYYYFY